MEELLEDIFNPTEGNGKNTMEIVEDIKRALNKSQTNSALFIAVTDSNEENGIISVLKYKEEEKKILLDFEKY
jgi:hypothetical protein